MDKTHNISDFLIIFGTVILIIAFILSLISTNANKTDNVYIGEYPMKQTRVYYNDETPELVSYAKETEERTCLSNV